VQLNRRAFIGGTVAASAGLAGCAGVLEQSQQESKEFTLADETVTLEEDEYYVWSGSLTDTVMLEYRFLVRRGPAVDVFVVTGEELQHYEDDERFRAIESTQDATEGSGSVTLGEGEHALVLDNTDAGDAVPPSNLDNDPIEVDVEATYWRTND